MNEQELKALLEGVAKENGNAIRQAVKTEIEAATQGLMKTSDLAAKLDAMGIRDGVIKQLTDAITKQGEEMRKLFQTTHVNGKSLEEIVLEQADAIKAIAKGGPSVRMSVNKTLITRATLNASTLGMRLPDVGQLAYPNTVMSSLFRHANVSPGTGGVIRYVEQVTATRNAAWVAEGTAKPESAITWSERLLPIEKVADSIPVTKEAWSDIPFIQGEIRRLLEINLALKIDDSLYDGSGVTPEIKGVYTSAPAFVTTPYADTVEAANLFDLIAVVAADIAANRGSKYAPDTVLLNPTNMLGMTLSKNAYGYLLPPFGNITNGSYTSIMGLKIVASGQVTANTMVVGDFRYGTIYDLEDLTIEMGWINDQFIKNCFTILAEQRLALLIRTGDEQAFRKVTNITTALADLETP